MNCEFQDNIFGVDAGGFETMALKMFWFQYRNNKIYCDFVKGLKIDPEEVKCVREIPFLPINSFKMHAVKTTEFLPEYIFESSGTTQTINSRHYIRHLSFYEESFLATFRHFYGDPREWCVIGLLPSYLERKNSSLVMMVDELIRLSRHPQSGFYLNEFENLYGVLQQQEKQAQKTILIGVTFGLLDFVEKHDLDLQYTVVMETGGMKGRREELTRGQVHGILKEKLGVKEVHSEYGMTELLSQAYSTGNGLFHCPSWMKALVRDEDDPLLVWDSANLQSRSFVSGALNIIDLANLYSCAFIATDDVGRLYADGSFEVMGRMDNSDMRGCSLMVV